MSNERIELNPEEIEALIERLEAHSLLLDDFPLIAKLLKTIIWLNLALKEKKLSIKRLRKVFGIKTESAKKLLHLLRKNPSLQLEQNSNQEENKKPKGHGHRPASDYEEAKVLHIAHKCLKRKDRCPACLKGRLFKLTPGSVLRIVGSPWLEVEIYRPERFRCSACGKIFTAELPKDITGGRVDKTAQVIVSLLKYRGGLPFYRQAKLQEAMGNPISITQLWEMTEEVANCLYPIFKSLCLEAAQGECIHNDDTKARILDLIRENKNLEKGERKGMFTTAILSKKDGKQIALFFTGRKNSGENLDDILDKRSDFLSAPIQMSDGSSQNTPERHSTLSAKCLAHARRKFYEIVEFWPEQVLPLITYFDDIFLNDREAKDLTPEERLQWHQKESAPIMDKIKAWCLELLKTKKAEPNSSLGKAIAYLDNHWAGLTLFIKEPKAPLSNNDDERLIKRAVLNRKNAYFYRTEIGAKIGDILMSVIETCCLNGGNAWDYLLQIQTYIEDVKDNPRLWFPWNYNKRVETLKPNQADEEMLPEMTVSS